jgi:hypothetical protein
MIIPNAIDESSPTIFRDNPNPSPLILDPGDTAFVSSMEKARFDWNIGGSIGDKFHQAVGGMLLVHGYAVDPGYGRIKDGNHWKAAADCRLQFVVSNVGGKRIVLSPGERIAVLQLYETEPVPEDLRRTIDRPGLDYFDAVAGNPAGLLLFQELRNHCKDSEIALREGRETEARTNILQDSIRTMENGSRFVVVFGVFLVSITILGVALSVLVGLADRVPRNPSFTQNVFTWVGGVTVTIATLAIVSMGVSYLWRLHTRDAKKWGDQLRAEVDSSVSAAAAQLAISNANAQDRIVAEVNRVVSASVATADASSAPSPEEPS